MSTATEIILAGYRRIGVDSIAQRAEPEDINDGKGILVSMLQMWQSKGIRLGIVPVFQVGEELSEPADTTNAIIDNFAILAAPNYDNGEVIVSQTLKDNARSGYNYVKELYQKFNIPLKGISSTAPMGAGNKSGYRRRTFAGRNAVIE